MCAVEGRFADAYRHRISRVTPNEYTDMTYIERSEVSNLTINGKC